MDLIRDLLDEKVVDRNGREIGRVDTIVLEIRHDAPPRVSAIELGPAVLAYRMRPVLGRCVAGIEHAFGVDEERPLRIAFSQILGINEYVKVDLAVGETVAAAVERRLREWLGALPGSS